MEVNGYHQMFGSPQKKISDCNLIHFCPLNSDDTAIMAVMVALSSLLVIVFIIIVLYMLR